MLDADWYADGRVTEPARINMNSDENRLVTIGLSQAVAVGETIRSVGITSKLVGWRVPSRAYPNALDAAIIYNSTTKSVSRKINAAVLPKDTPLAYQVSFDVETPIGPIDRRSVVLVIVVRV